MLNTTLRYTGTANGETLSNADRDYYCTEFDRVLSEGLSREEYPAAFSEAASRQLRDHDGEER
jgi:hypothetical protein